MASNARTGISVARIALLLLIAAAIASFFVFDLGHYLTLEALKARSGELVALVEQRPVFAAAGFFLVYVAVTACSLPGAAILTLAAGAVFGLWQGLVIVSFASTIGATLAFLSARFLMRGYVERRLGERLRAVDEGVARDGPFYLLSLRLVPAFPFFLVNLAMGLTAMRTWTFFWVSQIGMLPGTFVYVNAGTQLRTIAAPGDVLSPALLGSFLLLAIFPWIAKAALGAFRRRRLYARFNRPRRFDRNLIVIGAGAGGLVASLVAATVRARVTLVEANEMGGDCLNTGCVPSKALLRAARAAAEMRSADRFGIAPCEPSVDLPAVMARVRAAIEAIAPNDSVERYTGLGVDVRRGYARLVDPWTVEIAAPDGTMSRLTGRAIVVASGAEPMVPPIAGIESSGYLTSETLWNALENRGTLPQRLVILGGGPIGCEMAQAFARLGAKVTLVEKVERLLTAEDPDIAALATQALVADRVEVLCGHEGVRCEPGALVVQGAEGERRIPFDTLLLALGRKPRVAGYGLEEIGIDVNGGLAANPFLETTYPNILVAGDVSGSHQFTHFAAHQAWCAAVNGLFGQFRRFRADRSVMPWVTYLDPEVAHVGHNETSARQAGIAHEVVRYDLGHLDRAIVEGAARGVVKLLVVPGKDRILGATIVGAHAGELIGQITLAMKHGIGLNGFLATMHAYPTMMEGNRFAAGEWKKAHKPDRLLALVERYHAWRIGQPAPQTSALLPARSA